jgi:oligoendopeptidase F
MQALVETEAPSWDLGDLYRGLDDPALASDLAALQQAAAQFRTSYRGTIANLSAAQILECLQTLESIATRSGYLYAYPSLIFSANTQDQAAKQAVDRVMAATTDLHNQLLFFDLELQDLDTAEFAALQALRTLLDHDR